MFGSVTGTNVITYRWRFWSKSCVDSPTSAVYRLPVPSVTASVADRPAYCTAQYKLLGKTTQGVGFGEVRAVTELSNLRLAHAVG